MNARVLTIEPRDAVESEISDLIADDHIAISKMVYNKIYLVGDQINMVNITRSHEAMWTMYDSVVKVLKDKNMWYDECGCDAVIRHVTHILSSMDKIENARKVMERLRVSGQAMAYTIGLQFVKTANRDTIGYFYSLRATMAVNASNGIQYPQGCFEVILHQDPVSRHTAGTSNPS